MTFRRFAWVALGVVAVLVVALGVGAKAKKLSPVGWDWYGDLNNDQGVALAGYDALSYFAGQPVLGDDTHSTSWNGVAWKFATSENEEKFAANPETYAPSYGGFCAFAVSKGFKADVDPMAYVVENGRLVLFADMGVRQAWLDGSLLEQSEKSWANR